ncbi:hypothetical protein A2U01_0041238, partial [Trifolium medium]|nr:hypothetical protein [Trifolium medium]
YLTTDLLRPVLFGVGGGACLFFRISGIGFVKTWFYAVNMITIESIEYLCVVLLEASHDQDLSGPYSAS